MSVEVSVRVGVPDAHLSGSNVAVNVPQNSMCVLILGHTLVNSVGFAVVAGLSEAKRIHSGSNRDSQKEPRGSTGGALGQRGSVCPGASYSTVHQDH